ncbi:E3 ubiquitin-protein ligase Topors [Bufo gargarizans]|uniref:E3 ubiquitin-protein ligase Topors n=1 Tax=Bufo gargarizans TaxID=30331 RepID=UPI001CF56199|nr:E3 ubiquitin-protein ligase Topors [Bufo gargarizans]
MREKRSKRLRAGRKETAPARRCVLPSPADDFAVDSGISPKAGASSKMQSQGAPADASPDSKCPICLDRFDNVSHLDRCLHRFCFRCIQEWAKNKAECPLCKQPFNSIFHSVRAEDDFKEYVLRPTLNGSFGSPDGHRFRYRTTMTQGNYLSLRSLRSSSRRTFSPPDNGVLFEGISNVSSQQRGSDIHQMMRRLATRRQASAEGRTMRQIQEQELINFRRALYRAGLRVRNIQDGGRYRDISAEFFRRNPACLHRLVPWLKRELTVLFGSHGSLVNIVQHIIMRNVTLYDMESQAFVEDLQPFFLHRTNHFIHELINFARCPYNIEAYDQHANYDCPAPSYEEGSRSESSVITISPDEVNAREPDVPSSSLDVGQAPWDDETPGPSYTSVDRPVSWTEDILDEQPSSSRPTASDAKSGNKDVQDKTVGPDDCVIVGFVKPLAERTPELVELSSDSEGSLCEVKIEQAKKPQIKPFTLIGSSGSSRSSSPLSSHSSEKNTLKFSQKHNTSGEKSHSKKKEHKPKVVSSRNGSRKDKVHLFNSESSRHRTRSQSSDCFSRSSRNKSYESHSRKDRKNSPRNKKSPAKSRHKSWREKKRSRSRDRSSSWRSQTVSLTSESSRERGGSRSASRNLRGRSRSRDSDVDYAADNYRSTYQWEYTYYSRNRDRDGYEKSFRKHARGKGHYSRPSSSPEYRVQSYAGRKDLKRKKGSASAKQHHRDRYRSRSRSCSRTNTSGASLTNDKPSGKRKYKTRHLERQEEEERNREVKAKQENAKTYKDDLTETSIELKRRKKTRSPSVEIVYEGKATESSRCHKKKKKKHKKKHRREHPANSTVASPIIITIDSDSDVPTVTEASTSDKIPATPEKSQDWDLVQSEPSQSPSTSATANLTEPVSVEPAGPTSKDSDIISSNGHLDAATGILDGLHFDDSSDEPALPTTSSPAKIHSPPCEETAMTELPLPDFKSEQQSATSTEPTFLMDTHENFSENSQEIFAETISDLLESMAAPSVL